VTRGKEERIRRNRREKEEKKRRSRGEGILKDEKESRKRR
jgi:hypothetical protein